MIDAGGAGAAGRGDAADGDVVGARVVDIDAGREARDVLEILDAANIHGVLGQRRDADRHLAEAFLVAGRRHDDFLQGPGCFVAPAAASAARTRPGDHGGRASTAQQRLRPAWL